MPEGNEEASPGLEHSGEEMQREAGWAGSWAAGRACAKRGRRQRLTPRLGPGAPESAGEAGKGPGRTNAGARLSYPLQVIGTSPKHET